MGFDLSCGVHVFAGGCMVEGHRGLLDYAPERVRVRRRRGSVAIEGQSLAIVAVSRDEVWVRGVVHSVVWYE